MNIKGLIKTAGKDIAKGAKTVGKDVVKGAKWVGKEAVKPLYKIADRQAAADKADLEADPAYQNAQKGARLKGQKAFDSGLIDENGKPTRKGKLQQLKDKAAGKLPRDY